jgi:hypothetical protein
MIGSALVLVLVVLPPEWLRRDLSSSQPSAIQVSSPTCTAAMSAGFVVDVTVMPESKCGCVWGQKCENMSMPLRHGTAEMT